MLTGKLNRFVITVFQNPRPREPQRRRTTAVVYNPHSNRSLDYDDPGTMSDVELSSFQRGGYARTSLPIVRSASSSLERPIGKIVVCFWQKQFVFAVQHFPPLPPPPFFSSVLTIHNVYRLK